HAGIIRFRLPSTAALYPDACTLLGYAKIQDYFWYLAIPAVAILVAVISGGIRRERLGTRDMEQVHLPGWEQDGLPSAAACMGCFALAVSWLFDPWSSGREFDLLHEGLHLLTAQAW